VTTILPKVKISEKGKLLIYFMGEEAGFEEYEWIEGLHKFVLSAKGEMNKPISLITDEMTIEVDKEFKPIRFYFKGKVNGVSQEIETTVFKEEVKNKIKVGLQEREFTARISKNALFLPNGIFSPYVVVCKKAISSIKAKQTLPAYIVPQMEVDIIIEPDKEKKNSFHLNLAGVKIEILTDGNGKLHSLLIPSQSIEVYEESYKKEEKTKEIKGIEYALLIGGKKLGKGYYNIEEKEGNILIKGETQQVLGPISFNFFFEENLSPDWNLKNAVLKGKLNDEDVELRAKVENGKIKTYFKQGDKSLEKNFVYSDDIIFSTQNYLADYLILIKKLSNQAKKKFYILTKPWGSFYLDEAVLIPILIEKTGEEILEWKSKEIKAKRYFIDLAGTTGGYIWAQKNKIIKISFPFQATDIYYSEFKNLKTKEIKSPEIKSEKYISEEVVFHSGKIKLAGTLTIPKDNRKKHPGVILISGSGPQDRNEDTVGPGGLKFGIFKQIAHVLSENGIAVLRYDDRGVGKSEGKFKGSTQEDFVQDVKSAIEFLRNRKDILKNKIALIGHSEGAIIALRIAKENPNLVKAIVLLAGTAKTGDEVLMEQFTYTLKCLELSEKEKVKFLKNYENFLKFLKGKPVDKTFEEKIMPLIRPQIKWLKSFVNYDPLAELDKIKAKILIINGGKDKQVFPHHARMLYSKLKELNKDVTLKIFPDLNHLLIPSKTGNYSEYSRQMMEEKRISPELLKFLLDWLKRVFFAGGTI
jgi:hypothetical protein